MAGAAPDGQLTASPAATPARAHLRFSVATRADDAAIRRLLRDNPMRGAISVSFEHEPDTFASHGLAGAADQTIVAHESGRLVCMGRCATRTLHLDGEPRRVGYLGELRLDSAARQRVRLLRDGYAFFRATQEAAPADFYFTSIVADNARARHFLERGLHGRPSYRRLTGFTTLLVPVSRRAARERIDASMTASAAELAAFLQTHARRHQLTPVWTEALLQELAAHGLTAEDFCVLRERAGGRIVACGALWDQRSFRQTVIRDYAPWLRASRPIVNACARLMGGLQLPPVGTTLANAFVFGLAWEPDRENLLPRLLIQLRSRAAERGLACLALGLADGDAALAVIRRTFGGRAYRSLLYQVSWPDLPSIALADAGRRFLPETALL